MTRDRLIGSAYAAGWAIVRRAPEPLMRAVFRVMADVLWKRRGPGVQRLEANLRRVVGTDEAAVRAASRAGMRSYARYWLDVFRLPVWSRDRILRDVHFDGLDYLRSIQEQGRGVVFALPHMANWDLAGAWIIAQGYSFTTVAERLKPAELFDRFVAFRESIGMEVLALTGSERSPYEVLRARVKSGGIVCLVADRDMTASGIPVDFFGDEARFPAGPAMLALATGAALVPVSLWYEKNGLRGAFGQEIPVPQTGDRRAKVTAMTQQLANEFAAGIAAAPQDWHMLQKFWVADLSPERRAAVEGANA